jgi:hypothetical protein
MQRVCAALAIVVGVSAAAQARPTIYKGTIGSHAVVVEFSDDIASARNPVAGRYFYPAQGVDIPLDPVSAGSGKAELAEEKPCNEEICKPSEGDAEPKPPIATRWTLTAAPNGTNLEGTWQGPDRSALPIRLQRVADRPVAAGLGDNPNGEAFARTPEGLALILHTAGSSRKPLDQASPYDFLKMQVKLEEGPETVWGQVAFRSVVDPRTKFGFPRVTRLGSPVDAGHPVNIALQNRHWTRSLSALACKAMQYRGFGWTEAYPGSEAPDLGGYDEQTIEVEYLSPTVMSWLETGSIECGGAHPSHDMSITTLDVKRGTILDLSRVFRAWVARPYGKKTIVDAATARAKPDSYVWGPDEKLRAFLLKQAKSNPDLQDCELEDTIRENVQISFKQGERAVFSLVALPHRISGVCQGSFFEAPLAELRAFLAPEAVAYFPSLKAP